MPDWMSWLHMPKFTDEEFAKQKAAHIAKHGYTITVPGFSDIIHIKTPPPLTPDETMMYKKKAWAWFSPERLEQIREMKAKKKARYDAMLASPTPAIVNNFGSIMCAVDDAQDAVSTLACVGSMARAVAPKIIAKALLGPVGVLWTVADVLNLIQSAPQACLGWKDSKKRQEAMTKASPKHTKARLKKVDRLARALPRQADWIQAAQVTDQIFGFGICLGPLVGLAIDIVSGAARTMQGYPVKVKLPVKGITRWGKTAYRHIKSVGCALTYPIMSDDEEVLVNFSASLLAYQYLHDDIQDWHPLDMIEDVATTEVMAPIPTDPLTLEVIEEGEIPLSEGIGWPQTNKLWTSIEELADTTQYGASENLKLFVERNKHSFMGYWGASAGVESAMFALASLQHADDLTYDYTAAVKICNKLLEHSTYLDPAQGAAKLRDFAGFMDQCEKNDDNPTFEDIKKFCGGPAAIKLKEC